MGLMIVQRDSANTIRHLDLRDLTIADKRCSEMTQAELWRALAPLGIPGITVNDGHQALCMALAKWMNEQRDELDRARREKEQFYRRDREAAEDKSYGKIRG